MEKNFRFNIKFDYILAVTVVALCVIGILMIGNATGNPTVNPDDANWLQVISSMTNKTPALLNLLWFGLGIVTIVIILFFDYRILDKFWIFIYVANILLLGLVLVLGKTVGGTTGWFAVGNVRAFQPSEVAKIALIIVMAKQLSNHPEGIKDFKSFGILLGLFGLPLALIIGQPDLGTAMVYIFIFYIMMFLAGTKWWMLVGVTIIGIFGIIILWNTDIMNDNRISRLLVFIDPDIDPTGAGYNLKQSLISVGSGGLSGKGFFSPDAISQLNYLPAESTDFIFAATAETWGLVGSLVIIGLYLVLIIRMLAISRQAFDLFGSYLVIGVMAMFMFHIFENVGMCIGIMPITGIPLPFLSYGGSNMLTNLISVGIVLNVFMRRKRGIFTTGDKIY